MKDIAKEYQIEWDTTESEKELLKPPKEKIYQEGPKTFVSASSLPVKHAGYQSSVSMKQPTRVTGSHEMENTHFQDTASAEAAAESAKQVVAAAQAAAYLANRDSGNYPNSNSPLEAERFHRRHSYNVPPAHSTTKFYDSDSFEGSQFKGSDGLLSHFNDPKMCRRHSYNAPSVNSDIKFDESDYDDEIEMDKLPPSSHIKRDPVHHVHPKLPGYDDIAARFDALKYRK